MASRVYKVNPMYKYRKPTVLEDESAAKLPEAFKKFYREWKMTTPSPVHYKPHTSSHVRNAETGEVKQIQNVEIPLKFPPESHQGIWGGEAIIKGFQNRRRKRRPVAHFWFPVFKKTVVHSEILDLRMSVTVTDRTINLIHENYGFDHYILKTPACDLQSGLAVKLKQKMLLALYEKDLYNDNPVKQEDVIEKYKHYLDSYTREEIEWYGLTLLEAQRKQAAIEKELNVLRPLKNQYRMDLIKRLQEEGIEAVTKPGQSEQKPSWMSKFNPFASKTT